MTNITNIHRKKFVEHIYGRMKGQLTGAAYDKIYGDKPQSRFFVGSLCSRNPKNKLGNIRTKVAPVSMGVEFLIKKEDIQKGSVKISPSFSTFLKVKPNFEEQIGNILKENKWNKEDFSKHVQEQKKLSVEGKESEFSGVKPLSVFNKIRMEGTTFNVKLSNIMDGDNFSEKEVKEAKNLIDNLFSKYDTYQSKIYVPKKLKRDEMTSLIPYSVFTTEEDFNKYMDGWGEKDINSVKPDWDLTIKVKISDFDKDCAKVTVRIENICCVRDSDNVDNFLFNVGLNVELEDANIQDFIVDYLNDHYRYDGNMESIGINCEAQRLGNKVTSESMPFFKEFRTKTRTPVEAKFADLGSEKCMDVLKSISLEMRSYLSRYDQICNSTIFKSEEGKRRYQQDKELFENEINQFEYGMKILAKYPMVLKAFQKMNLAFLRSSKTGITGKSFDSWRLFQIIFIVINVPDVVSTEYTDIESNFERVEVLYFKTGGGKTESYLGLSVFTLFFDRYRGKKFGVSVMTKFPLRLLSLQQIQRIANIMAQAELIRREDDEISNTEMFSLGYYVGDRNTPNKLMTKGTIFGGQDKDLLTPLREECERVIKGNLEINDEKLDGRKYLIVSKCPFCGSKDILIDGDPEKIRLLHRCMNKECGEDILPIYISDMEIYRYLPSFIISTLDKIAICGLQKNFRNLFGQVTHKCPLHGYSNSSDCTEKYLCKVEKSQIEPVEIYDPVPTLQIQDEMHLVRESLGTFNSHYESFLETFEKHLTNNKRSVKIIAATATISEYKQQTDHLYAKKANMFPTLGPSLQESFYTKIDNEDLNRMIIGITPHFKTKIFAQLDVIGTYHKLIHYYLKNPSILAKELELNFTNEEIISMLQDYKLKLSYHLAKTDGDSVSNSIRTMTNRSLREEGFPEIKQAPLTGDVSFNEVRLVLDKVEDPDKDDPIDLIIATSMISHGVDLDTLNMMVFMGMTNNTAEYIQSSSRTGRKSPGIVFVIFNPTRERDRSYFKFFSKFHEYRDLLVEAVPINRWAKFSINKTLPGIFTATMINYFDIEASIKLKKSINMSKPFTKAFDDNIISEDDVIKFITECYKLGEDSLGFGFDKVIKKKCEDYIFEIKESLANEFIPKPMSDKPMMSLRDVDKMIDINLSVEGGMILENIKASRTLAYNDDEGVNEEEEAETENVEGGDYE